MVSVHGGGGAKQRIIKYRLCRRYEWMQKSGYANIETLSCMGLCPPSAPNQIIMGAGLCPPSP